MSLEELYSNQRREEELLYNLKQVKKDIENTLLFLVEKSPSEGINSIDALRVHTLSTIKQKYLMENKYVPSYMIITGRTNVGDIGVSVKLDTKKTKYDHQHNIDTPVWNIFSIKDFPENVKNEILKKAKDYTESQDVYGTFFIK